MNIKPIILSLCIILTSSLSISGYACGSCNNTYKDSCEKSCFTPGEDHYSWTSCSCTDPHCDGNNPCLGSGRCCKLFGNIGYNGES